MRVYVGDGAMHDVCEDMLGLSCGQLINGLSLSGYGWAQDCGRYEIAGEWFFKDWSADTKRGAIRSAIMKDPVKVIQMAGNSGCLVGDFVVGQELVTYFRYEHSYWVATRVSPPDYRGYRWKWRIGDYGPMSFQFDMSIYGGYYGSVAYEGWFDWLGDQIIYQRVFYGGRAVRIDTDLYLW